MLALLWLGSLLGCGFSPWPGNFHMPWAQPEKKKKVEMRKGRGGALSPQVAAGVLAELSRCPSPAPGPRCSRAV